LALPKSCIYVTPTIGKASAYSLLNPAVSVQSANSNESQQALDSKYVPDRKGIFYPRAATLGGCTAHNAMITVYPHNSDWKHIAEITGDSSWEPDRMRNYFERLEKCGYLAAPSSGEDPIRHGFSGWLATSLAKPELALTDIDLLGEIRSAVCQSFLQSRMRDRFGTLLRLAKDVSRPGVELRDFLPMRIAQSD
jgi:hypothetical protein